MVEAAPEQHAFTAEVTQLLTILVHSVYSTKEVFLRELISNASDALDKIRFKSLSDSELLGDDVDLQIKIIPNDEEKTITIRDNGIGMSKSEMVNFLGRIAKSGTRAFAQALEKSSDEGSNLIGQFGIGFYSAFLIADRVTVISKSPWDDCTHQWESDASSAYTIQQLDNYELNRGTEVILHVKEGNYEFLKDSQLENIIKKHSSYVVYPIKLACQKTKEVEDEDAEEEKPAEGEEKKDEDGNLEEVKKDEDGAEKKKKMKTVHYIEDKHINNEPRIWANEPSTITEEQYTATYKTLTKSWEAPFMSKVYEANGACEFKLLIFIHKRQKSEVFESRTDNSSAHAKLFSKGVFINDFTKQDPFFESAFQSFCFVAIDVDDLPQSLSRENIVSNKLMQLFKKHAKSKILAMIQEIKKDETKWTEFYKNHAHGLKLGAFEDPLRGDEFLELIEWDHSMDKEKNIILKDYAEKAKESKQDKIYYITGKNLDVLRENETVLKLKEMGHDVLLSTSPIDEFVFNKRQKYNDMSYQDITKDGFVLADTEDSKAKREKYEEEYKEFCTKAKGILSGIVSDIKVKDNFVGPYAIQVPNHAMSAQMENLHNSQPMGSRNAFFMNSMKTLAINPDHKEVQWLKEKVMAGEQIGSEVLKIICQVCLIGQGYSLEKPEQFVKQINKMLSWAMGDASSSENEAPLKVPESVPSALDQVD